MFTTAKKRATATVLPVHIHYPSYFILSRFCCAGINLCEKFHVDIFPHKTCPLDYSATNLIDLNPLTPKFFSLETTFSIKMPLTHHISILSKL